MEASQLPGLRRGGGGESALVVASSSVFLFRGDGGQSASGAVKGECFESALELSSAGNGGESASGAVKGDDLSQLWSWVVVSSSVFLFRGDGGQSASGAVKGECFESALELS